MVAQKITFASISKLQSMYVPYHHLGNAALQHQQVLQSLDAVEVSILPFSLQFPLLFDYSQ
jgi:hypothetical protein